MTTQTQMTATLAPGGIPAPAPQQQQQLPAENALATTTGGAMIGYGNAGLVLRSLDDAWRFARYVVASGLAPKGMEKPETVLVACQMGAELGITPMASLQSIAVINGRPAIYGDAALALVRSSGLLIRYEQSIAGEGDARTATVIVQRANEAAQTHTFSVGDAKRAQLWGKTGPWSQYPDRMLMFRARGFALRDAFGDVLRGLRTYEEARDIPAVEAEVSGPRPIKGLEPREGT